MNAAFEAVLDDQTDENLPLVEWYEENFQFLRSVFLQDVPYKLKHDIAVLVSKSSPFDYEWKEILFDLGLDSITIDGIDLKSRSSGTVPLYLALTEYLQSKKSFGAVIEVLCKKEKFHVLRHVKPFAEYLIKVQECLKEEEDFLNNQPSAPKYDETFTDSEYQQNSIKIEHSESHGNGSSLLNRYKKRGRIVNHHNTAFDTLQNSIFMSEHKESSAVFQSQISIMVSNDLPSVFIMHKLSDKKYAKRLALFLEENNFEVITSYDIQSILRENDIKIMKLIHDAVDLVVPILSEDFLEQISFTTYHANNLTDIESGANLFLYILLMKQYSLWGCENRRVRPVCTSLKSRSLADSDPILGWSFYLKDEVPKLVKELKKAKKRLKY